MIGDMSTKRLTVITASTRPGRVGHQIADWFSTVAVEHDGFEVRSADLAEINLPFHDEPDAAVEGGPYLHEHTQRWSDTIAATDAFVIVMPEYNRGYSAPLKNALDYLYYEWNDKPVGFVSYGMSSAGMRAVEQIKPVVGALKMIPIADSVNIHLRQALDADAALTLDSRRDDAARGMVAELYRITAALSTLRVAV